MHRVARPRVREPKMPPHLHMESDGSLHALDRKGEGYTYEEIDFEFRQRNLIYVVTRPISSFYEECQQSGAAVRE
jgi:hypothetical protein